MNTELVNTGTELMLGFVTNTNQQWLCRELSRRSYLVTRQVAIADGAAVIQQAVREALGRAELVICTGGLGPTSDDLTRQCLADWLGLPLREDPTVLAPIQEYFQSRNRPMPDRVRVQALVPEGATILRNGNGTAPGLALEVDSTHSGASGPSRLLILLPGPPRELQPMFVNEVLPLLQKRFPQRQPFACRVLKSTGMGESLVEERIAGALQPFLEAGLEVGYCARFGEVDVRLVAQGVRANELVESAEAEVRKLMGRYIFGTESDDLPAVIVRQLTDRGETVALAESCTGGYVAHRITNVPGASAVFLGGFTTYSNRAKQTGLGVAARTLAEHGAVSEQTARQMAEGALAKLGATYALAVTGIAGPSGGSPEKPVGTVFLALAGGGPTLVLKQLNRYDRESFKFVTSQQALEMLRRRLLRESPFDHSVEAPKDAASGHR